MKVSIKELDCKRCGHVWLPRRTEVLTCPNPKCRSPYWNRERVTPEEKEAKAKAKTQALEKVKTGAKRKREAESRAKKKREAKRKREAKAKMNRK